MVRRGVWHRGIAKHAHDMQQRIGVAERREIEQRLGAGLGAAGAGDVGELHRRGHVLARIEERRQAIEAGIGDAGNANVGFRLSPGPRRLARARQQLKERRLARRRESKQACSEHVNGGPALVTGRSARGVASTCALR